MMNRPASFITIQRGVGLRMGAGAIAALALVMCGARRAMAAAPVAWETRGLWLAVAALALAVPLALGIANVARLRFFSPQDIDGSASGEASEAVRLGNAFIQNSLEQAGLALPVYAALSLLLPDPRWLLGLLAAAFLLGRLLFAAGYAKGAPGRAIGFVLCFYPTLMALVLALGFIAGRLI